MNIRVIYVGKFALEIKLSRYQKRVGNVSWVGWRIVWGWKNSFLKIVWKFRDKSLARESKFR
jgi:hypothetical protein